MQTTTQRRALTSKKVARTLAQAGIPNIGANKLSIIGRGNGFVRDDGTAVVIYNVQAFRSKADADEANALWKKGHALEMSGDLETAQPFYTGAYNKLMSFSVLAENADQYNGVYDVTVKVEEVKNREGKTVLGLNQPRPVAVATSIQGSGHSYDAAELADEPKLNAAQLKALQKEAAALAK